MPQLCDSDMWRQNVSAGSDVIDTRFLCILLTLNNSITCFSPQLLYRIDTMLGEECDDGANGDDTDGCLDTCKFPVVVPDIIVPYCGDGVVNTELGEECDMGSANGDPLIDGGCKADCTFCKCEASATYNAVTGAVTIDFDMCGQEPLSSDFIGIYPCDAATRVADRKWWATTVCKQFPRACGSFQFGYVEGQTYVAEDYTWFSYTCGSPQDGGCQTEEGYKWPSSGSVTIDPKAPGAKWAFGQQGRELKKGQCYKVLLNREMYYISPPPYPTICDDWDSALSFTVPNITRRLSGKTDFTDKSGSFARFSAFFVSLLAILVLFIANKE